MKLITLAFLLSASISAVAQISNTSLYFDGSDDMVSVPNHSAYSFHSSDFTIEAWIRDDASGNPYSQENIIRSGPEYINGIYTSALSFRVNAGYLEIYMNVAYATANGLDLRDGHCHHVAAVVDWETATYSTVSLYIDGNYAAWNQYYNYQDSLIIGTPLSLGGMHKGTLREIRMWNKARSQAEIQGTMNSVLTGNEPNLVAYWRMNDGSGTTVDDYSPLNNDGTLGTGTSEPAWAINCCNNICTAPATLAASNITGTKAKLNWSVTDCAIAYKVRYKPSGTSAWTNKNQIGTLGYKKISNLVPNTPYSWQVRTKCASNPNVWSSWSALSSFTTSLRLSGEKEEESCNIFPNPVTTSFTITLSNDGTYDFILCDMLGRECFRSKINGHTATIERGNLPGGVYFYRIVEEDNVIAAGKVVIE